MDSVIKCVHCGKLMTDPVTTKPGASDAADGATEVAAGAEAGASTAGSVPAGGGAVPNVAAGAAPGAAPAVTTGTAPDPTSGATPIGVQASQAAVTSHNQIPQAQPQNQSKQEPYFVMKTQPVTVAPGMPAPSGGYVGSDSGLSGMLAALFAVGGGLLAAGGAFMAWGVLTIDAGKVKFPDPIGTVPVEAAEYAAKGIDGWEGWLAVIGGVSLVFLGLGYLFGDKETAIGKLRVALLEAAILGGVAAYTYYTLDSALTSGITQELANLGADPALASQVTSKDLDSGLLHFSWSVGFWMLVAGAMMALISGIFAFLAGGPKVTAIAPGGANWAGAAPPPPPSPTGR